MNKSLAELHTLCMHLRDKSLPERLQYLAEEFIGTAYGPWVTGSSFESLDDYAYNLDTLDCVTYVEVVLSLAKTPPLTNYSEFVQQFELILHKLQFAHGKSNFMSRNHFMCLDWIPNNKFMVTDITSSLSANVKIAEAIIDKPQWMRQHSLNKTTTDEFPAQAVDALQSQVSRIPYIETDELLKEYSYYQTVFPEFGIVNIVRPNWDLTAQIGTPLNISHLGFVFKEEQSKSILFYHASSLAKKVVKTTLDTYMAQTKDNPTIQGVNVLAISPGL
jgi:hypothetical protein